VGLLGLSNQLLLQDLSRQWGLYSQLDLVGQPNLWRHSLLPLLVVQLLQQGQLIQSDLEDL
jgi:hypothetical protein